MIEITSTKPRIIYSCTSALELLSQLLEGLSSRVMEFRQTISFSHLRYMYVITFKIRAHLSYTPSVPLLNGQLTAFCHKKQSSGPLRDECLLRVAQREYISIYMNSGSCSSLSKQSSSLSFTLFSSLKSINIQRKINLNSRKFSQSTINLRTQYHTSTKP